MVRKGTKCITTFAENEPIVGMVNFKNKILVATTGAVYEISKKYAGGKKKLTFEAK